MRRCAEARCPYDASMDSLTCFFHSKLNAGHITRCPHPLCRRVACDKHDQHTKPQDPRTAVRPSDVCSDEQVEIARLLHKLGATPLEVKQAITRQRGLTA